jgi:hypothetical protein
MFQGTWRFCIFGNCGWELGRYGRRTRAGVGRKKTRETRASPPLLSRLFVSFRSPLAPRLAHVRVRHCRWRREKARNATSHFLLYRFRWRSRPDPNKSEGLLVVSYEEKRVGLLFILSSFFLSFVLLSTVLRRKGGSRAGGVAACVSLLWILLEKIRC